MIPIQCPHCKNDDPSMLEIIGRNDEKIAYRCEVCSKPFVIKLNKEKSNVENKKE